MRYLFVIARPSEVIMFPGSSVVEQLTVNQLVASSNLARGATSTNLFNILENFKGPPLIDFIVFINKVAGFITFSLKLLI
jgi:hypothetical protein